MAEKQAVQGTLNSRIYRVSDDVYGRVLSMNPFSSPSAKTPGNIFSLFQKLLLILT